MSHILHVFTCLEPKFTIHHHTLTLSKEIRLFMDWFLLTNRCTCISSATRCSSRRKARTFETMAVRLVVTHVFSKGTYKRFLFFLGGEGEKGGYSDERMEDVFFWGSMEKNVEKEIILFMYMLIGLCSLNIPNFENNKHISCLSASTLLADLSQLPNSKTAREICDLPNLDGSLIFI